MNQNLHNRSVNPQVNNERINGGVSNYKQRTSHKKHQESSSLNEDYGNNNNNMMICDNKIIDDLLDSDILNASGNYP